MGRALARIEPVLLAVVLSLGLQTQADEPATSPTASRRDELRRSYREISDRLKSLYQTLTLEQMSELDALMNRSWGVAEEWILTSLGENPDLSVDDIAAEVRALSPPRDPNADDVPGPLDVSVVKLATGEHAAYAIALHSGTRRGTVVIAARASANTYRIAWRIRDVRTDRPDVGELARWATYGPGFHDGPLDGKILRAPDNSARQPRFWVDAVSRPDAGLIAPAQVSLWRWTGQSAVLEFVSMYDAPGESHLEQRGDVLRVRVSTPLTCFAPCGACDGPHSTWSLRARDDGVDDMGRVDDAPELTALHEMLVRVAAGKDASDLAAPPVTAYFRSQYDDMHAKFGSDGDGDCWVGLLMGDWKVEHSGPTSRLDVWLDRLYPLTIQFETKGKKLFITRIVEHPERQ